MMIKSIRGCCIVEIVQPTLAGVGPRLCALAENLILLHAAFHRLIGLNCALQGTFSFKGEIHRQ